MLWRWRNRPRYEIACRQRPLARALNGQERSFEWKASIGASNALISRRAVPAL
jgi:hypothetical protein